MTCRLNLQDFNYIYYYAGIYRLLVHNGRGTGQRHPWIQHIRRGSGLLVCEHIASYRPYWCKAKKARISESRARPHITNIDFMFICCFALAYSYVSIVAMDAAWLFAFTHYLLIIIQEAGRLFNFRSTHTWRWRARWQARGTQSARALRKLSQSKTNGF